MKLRHADVLKDMGCDVELKVFRRTLAEAKAELFPEMTDEELCYTRDQASDYCTEVKKRVAAPKLSRVFILRSLVGYGSTGSGRRRSLPPSWPLPATPRLTEQPEEKPDPETGHEEARNPPALEADVSSGKGQQEAEKVLGSDRHWLYP